MRSALCHFAEAGLSQITLHVLELQIARPADLHGIDGLLQWRLGIVRNEQLDIVQADAVEPAIRMPVDQRRSLPMRHHVPDKHIANRSGRRLVGVRRAIHFAAAA